MRKKTMEFLIVMRIFIENWNFPSLESFYNSNIISSLLSVRIRLSQPSFKESSKCLERAHWKYLLLNALFDRLFRNNIYNMFSQMDLVLAWRWKWTYFTYHCRKSFWIDTHLSRSEKKSHRASAKYGYVSTEYMPLSQHEVSIHVLCDCIKHLWIFSTRIFFTRSSSRNKE